MTSEISGFAVVKCETLSRLANHFPIKGNKNLSLLPFIVFTIRKKLVKEFHVNPVTGNPGKCRARWDSCPFGDKDSAHFDSLEQARAHFEATQETFRSNKKAIGVFRIGALEPKKAHFPDLQKLMDDFEITTPEGRMGRAGALFASPDLASHSRWVLGVPRDAGDSHELMVDPNTTYVYPIELYENASSAQADGKMDEFKKLAQEYWDSGMLLAEWHSWAAKAKPDSGTWEVLVPPTAIRSIKPVSNRRVIENADISRRREVNWRLEPRRASKGLIWTKESKKSEILED